ncbi:MAG: D-aminoacyl-tRNA deacylase [Bifidobacterium thermacidophilum]|jgi:D-tyrosyl-tRNA(Tyr) deacylase|uniref:D-aminoacyl-tRNA deacylase n=1 Tax=Bifidobacterium thermacidophilum TaxID=246618 RepID=UPI002F350A49
MRIVLQRVSEAGVDVIDPSTNSVDPTFAKQTIGTGYVLLVGVADADGQREIDWLAGKIARLRIFEDADGRMNESIAQHDGEILSISQFTLYGNIRKGNRPSFIAAGEPEHAKRVWLAFNEALRAQGLTVKEGRFGAHMRVSLVNDGPVTLVVDTAEVLGE